MLCKWTSPVLLAFAYNRGYLTLDGVYSLCHLALVFGGFLVAAYVARAFGRSANADYKDFIQQYTQLNAAQKSNVSDADRRVSLKNENCYF